MLEPYKILTKLRPLRTFRSFEEKMSWLCLRGIMVLITALLMTPVLVWSAKAETSFRISYQAEEQVFTKERQRAGERLIPEPVIVLKGYAIIERYGKVDTLYQGDGVNATGEISFIEVGDIDVIDTVASQDSIYLNSRGEIWQSDSTVNILIQDTLKIAFRYSKKESSYSIPVRKGELIIDVWEGTSINSGKREMIAVVDTSGYVNEMLSFELTDAYSKIKDEYNPHLYLLVNLHPFHQKNFSLGIGIGIKDKEDDYLDLTFQPGLRLGRMRCISENWAGSKEFLQTNQIELNVLRKKFSASFGLVHRLEVRQENKPWYGFGPKLTLGRSFVKVDLTWLPWKKEEGQRKDELMVRTEIRI